MKKKIFIGVFALTAMLCVTGCGARDWFEKKTESAKEPPICDTHIDEDDDGYCDVCGMVDASHFASNWDI